MASQGRARRARPSYADLFAKANSDEETEASLESNQGRPRDGSVFDPEQASESAKHNSADELVSDAISDADMEVLLDEKESEEDVVVDKPSKGKSKNRGSVVKRTQDGIDNVQSLPNGTRPQRPAPKVTSNLPAKDHRHRPGSLWCPPSGVTRLAAKPGIFSSPELLVTTSSEDAGISHRVKKAWMYSVSAGPCWQLLEDRAFYKEEYIDYDATSRSGRLPRPLVYTELSSVSGHPSLPIGRRASYVGPQTFLECNLGPLGSQKLHKFAPLSSVPMSTFQEGDNSGILYTGGPVTCIDWCPTTSTRISERGGRQYMAIATLIGTTNPVKVGLPTNHPSPASIQFWSLSAHIGPNQTSSPKLSCELVACIEEGSALQLKWCPLPSHGTGKSASQKGLGILAAVTTNGVVGIYRVPEPLSLKKGEIKPSYIQVMPKLSLKLPETACQAIDWANSETIGVGGANGFIAVYYLKDAIVRGTEPTLTHYFPAQQTSIQSLSWIRAPPTKGDGSPILGEDPTIICSTGTEGVVKLTDIRDCIPRLLVRNREVPHASAYSSFCGSVLVTDVDFWVKLFQVQSVSLGKGHFMTDVGGAALSISVSDLHPILAVGSADGACTTTNMLRGTRREGAVPILNHKVYQLDYNTRTGQYRMLDHFLPRESGTSEGPAFTESTTAKVVEAEAIKERFENGAPEPSALWHPSVGVNTVAWNSGCGLASAAWLASGMACGLVRVDYLEGSWFRNVLPYGSVEAVRCEAGHNSAAASESE